MTTFKVGEEDIPEIIVLALGTQQKTIDGLYDAVEKLTAAGEMLAAAVGNLASVVDLQRERIRALEEAATP